MVFCNRNHKLLFEKIKDKIKAEYDELKAEARARVGRLVSTERQGQIGPYLDHNWTTIGPKPPRALAPLKSGEFPSEMAV